MRSFSSFSTNTCSGYSLEAPHLVLSEKEVIRLMFFLTSPQTHVVEKEEIVRRF